MPNTGNTHQGQAVHASDNPLANEYLTFKIGAENYAMNILCTKEIRTYEPPTHMTNSVPSIKGVIDLRGEIVPIFDLRVYLGCADIVYSEFTVVIIVNILNRSIGVVVDGVSDVISVKPDEVKPAPNIDGAIGRQCVQGIVSKQERMFTLLNFEALMIEAMPKVFE